MSNTTADELEVQFIPLSIAVLTISDTRTEETDKSGQLLVERLRDESPRNHLWFVGD